MGMSLWEFHCTSTWLSGSHDNSGIRIYVLLISSVFSLDLDDQNPEYLVEECKQMLGTEERNRFIKDVSRN